MNAERTRRLAAYPIAVVSAVVLAACGGSTRTVTETVAAPPAGTTTTAATPATATTATTPPPPKRTGPLPCDQTGINDHQLQQGTCITNGERITVVNKATPLRLKTLAATLDGISTHTALSDSSGQSATARGEFVVFTLSITNRADAPEQWQEGQATFYLATSAKGGSSYSESFDAENGPDQNSCLWKMGPVASGGLQPGESTTCDVIFDVPSGANVTSIGSDLDIENFGEADTSNPTLGVGVIRTYH